MSTLKLARPICATPPWAELRLAKGAWTQDRWTAHLWRTNRQRRTSAHQRRAEAWLERWRQTHEPRWAGWMDGNGYDAFGNLMVRDAYSPLPHEDDLYWEAQRWN